MNRVPTKSKIKFLRYLHGYNTVEMVTLDFAIPGFDKEITQIAEVGDGCYVAVNYKTHKLIYFKIAIF